jgi:hypothetical protein
LKERKLVKVVRATITDEDWEKKVESESFGERWITSVDTKYKPKFDKCVVLTPKGRAKAERLSKKKS